MYFLTYRRHTHSFLETYFFDDATLQDNYDEAEHYLLSGGTKTETLEEYKNYIVSLLDLAAYRFTIDGGDKTVNELIMEAREKISEMETIFGLETVSKIRLIVELDVAILFLEQCDHDNLKAQLETLTKYYDELDKGEHDSFYYEYKYTLITLWTRYSYTYDSGFEVISNSLTLVNDCLPYLNYMNKISYAKATCNAYANVAFMSESNEKDFYLSFWASIEILKQYQDVLINEGKDDDIQDLMCYVNSFIEELLRVKCFEPARYIGYKMMDFINDNDFNGLEEFSTLSYDLIHDVSEADSKARDDVRDLDLIKIYYAIGKAKSHMFYEDKIDIGLEEVNQVLPLAQNIYKTCKGHKMKLVLAYVLCAKSELLSYQKNIEEQTECLLKAYEIKEKYALGHKDLNLWFENVLMLADFAHDLKFSDQEKAEDIFCQVIEKLKDFKPKIITEQVEVLCEVFNDFIHMEVNMGNAGVAKHLIDLFNETIDEVSRNLKLNNIILFNIGLAHFYLSEIDRDDVYKANEVIKECISKMKDNPYKQYLVKELDAILIYENAMDEEIITKQKEELNKALDLLHSILNDVDSQNIEIYLNLTDMIQSQLEFDDVDITES